MAASCVTERPSLTTASGKARSTFSTPECDRSSVNEVRRSVDASGATYRPVSTTTAPIWLVANSFCSAPRARMTTSPRSACPNTTRFSDSAALDAVLREAHQCAFGRFSNARDVVIAQHHHLLNGVGELMTGDDPRAHLANSPGLVTGARDHDGRRAVVPRIEKSPHRPDSRPISLESAFSTFQDQRRVRT